MIDAIAAVGDVGDIRCWSGTPFHCLRAAQRLGWPTKPWRLPLREFEWPRRIWNARQLLSWQGVGGYQYSRAFLERAEERFLSGTLGQRILSFHHQFPRSASVKRAGGKVIYFLDATLGAMLDGHALPLELPRGAAQRALAIERENLEGADHIITMARWLKDYLVDEGGISRDRISVILPGANLDVAEDWSPPPSNNPAKGRPFILGFVGNDWERKGLRFLIEVVRLIQGMGAAARIRVIGRCPRDIDPETTDVLGVVDKGAALPDFLTALAGCDLGCLFSDKEAFGISILEFLRVGIPVAGFSHEGPADSIPPDAGFRFALGSTAKDVAVILGAYISSRNRQEQLRNSAALWSSQVTWERCLRELGELLVTGRSGQTVQPWLGSSGVVRPITEEKI